MNPVLGNRTHVKKDNLKFFVPKNGCYAVYTFIDNGGKNGRLFDQSLSPIRRWVLTVETGSSNLIQILCCCVVNDDNRI